MSRTVAEIEAKNSEVVDLGDFNFSLKSKELQNSHGDSVPLRTQSGEVLAYLAAHLGELVRKDKLIEAVWGDTFVTDDSLVQCIGDIRRALEDDSRKIVEGRKERSD